MLKQKTFAILFGLTTLTGGGLLIALAAHSSSQPVAVQPQVLGAVTKTPSAGPLPPALTNWLDTSAVQAKSFLVYDLASDAGLAGRNIDQQLPIASLTKLMTALVTYQKIDLKNTVTVDTTGASTISPGLKLRPQERVKASDLFNAMLVGSANDVAGVLANYVSAKTNRPFLDLMNEQAVALGMTHTHFNSVSGLEDDNNYSTANDLRMLVSALEQYKAFTSLGRKQSYSFKSLSGQSHTIKATNTLLAGDPEMTAIKTGFTDTAGGSMIVEITHQKHSFIIIVLNSPAREADVKLLKQLVLKSYSWK